MGVMYRLKEIVIRNMQVILYIIGEISLISTVVYLRSYDLKIMALIFALITILITIVNSVLKYKREITDHNLKSKLILVIRIVLIHTLLISITILVYEISLGKVFEQKSIYRYYNLLIAYIFISYTIIIFIGILRQGKKLIKEKAGITKHLFSALTPVIMLYIFISSFLYWLYIPENNIDISIDPKPASLSVSEHRHTGNFSLISHSTKSDKEIVINDDKLIESFINELSQVSVENMNGLEYIHQDNRTHNETYYWIYMDYRGPEGNIIIPEGLEKSFVSLILYKNGDLILSNFRRRHNFLFSRYNKELYRVTLSQEVTERIIGMFE